MDSSYQTMDGNLLLAQVTDSDECGVLVVNPKFAILGRWIPASLTGMTGFQHSCNKMSTQRGELVQKPKQNPLQTAV